jgi:hypothetical protein
MKERPPYALLLSTRNFRSVTTGWDRKVLLAAGQNAASVLKATTGERVSLKAIKVKDATGDWRRMVLAAAKSGELEWGD